MKVKAVIFKRDRNNLSKVLNKKERVDNKIKLGNHTYLITEKDNYRLTWGRKWYKVGMKVWYITYYFKEGNPSPIDFSKEGDINSVGITSEELNEIFTPWFWRTIAGAGKKDIKTDIAYYISIITMMASLASCWLIYKLPEKLGISP